MNVLFICNQNQNRSTTAEKIFKDRFNTRSAGLYNDSPVTAAQLSWAEVVVVMEGVQRSELAKRFPELYLQKRIISLEIPDRYYRDQPELVELLHNRVHELLQPIISLPLFRIAFVHSARDTSQQARGHG